MRFGVPLRTAEIDIEVVAPRPPGIRTRRVFDRRWDLLSRILPVWSIRAAVHRHFAQTVSYSVDTNLSRLSAQWEESINGAWWDVEKESRRRPEELLGMVEGLVDGSTNERAPSTACRSGTAGTGAAIFVSGGPESIPYLLVVRGGGTGALARCVAAYRVNRHTCPGQGWRKIVQFAVPVARLFP